MQIQIEGRRGISEAWPKIEIFGFFKTLKKKLAEEIAIYWEFLRSV